MTKHLHEQKAPVPGEMLVVATNGHSLYSNSHPISGDIVTHTDDDWRIGGLRGNELDKGDIVMVIFSITPGKDYDSLAGKPGAHKVFVTSSKGIGWAWTSWFNKI